MQSHFIRPVSVYVQKFSMNDQEQVRRMMSQTEQLQARQPPQQFVARTEGTSGRFQLHSWPYGRAKYVVLIHADRESEVTLGVHYSP